MKSKRNVILREKAEPVDVRVEEELENIPEEVEETPMEETSIEEEPESAPEDATEDISEEASEEEVTESEESSEEITEQPEESAEEESPVEDDHEEVSEEEETPVEEDDNESTEDAAPIEPIAIKEIETKNLPHKKHSIEKEKSKRIRGIIAEILIMLLFSGAILGAMIKISAPPEENKNIDKTMVHVVGMGNVWLRQGEDWVYMQADRTYATGWVQISPTENSPNDKEWCYFDEDGIFVNSYDEKDEPSKNQIPITKGNLIVINLSSQLLYLYNKGECIFCTNIISGKSGYDTPTGEYTIRAKATNVSLKGESEGEKWDSHVTFWMPFIGGSVGIHDATWQPEWKFQDPSAHYGGGSHGCVNMRYGDAAALFNMIDVGTKVVVQY